MHKTHVSVLLILLIPVFLLSCSILNGDDITVDEIQRPWELNALFDVNGNEIQLFDSELHTIRFNQQREFTGATQCNEYGGAYLAERDGDFKATEIASTDELCSEPNHSEEFLSGLAEAKRYELESGRLTLFFGKEGRLVFFERLE